MAATLTEEPTVSAEASPGQAMADAELEAAKQKSANAAARVHPVQNYPNNANMWVKLMNLEKEEKI